MNYLHAFSVLSCNHLSYHKSVYWLSFSAQITGYESIYKENKAIDHFTQ